MDRIWVRVMGDPWVRITPVVDTIHAHFAAAGASHVGLDIEETVLEEVGGFAGALSWAIHFGPPTRHAL